jgi:hypothetical protein
VEQDCIFAAPKDLCQHGSGGGLTGMPPPALVACLADTTPPLLPLGFPSVLTWLPASSRGLSGVAGLWGLPPELLRSV